MNYSKHLSSWKERLSRDRLVISAYFAVFCVILAVYAALGVYPFGDVSVLKADLFHSYAPTLNDVRTKVLNGQSVVYSWSGGLGSRLLTNLVTTGFSPFNILMFLIPVEYTSELVAFLILMKTPFCAVTFFLFLRNKFKREDMGTLIFSCLYALSAYMTAYHWNIMWIDTAVLLPLVAMGIDRLFDKPESKLYFWALLAAIVTSYGTAIFACFFAVAYFLMGWFETNNLSRDFIKPFVRFSLYSLTAGFLMAVFLWPIVLGFRRTHYFGAEFPAFEFYGNVLKFYAAHFSGLHPTSLVFSNSTPNIYAGTLTALLLPFFFLNREVKLRKKVMYGGFMLFLYLCFNINILTFIMHGLHFPAMMPHRYSFLYSFMALLMAYEAFIHFDKARMAHFAVLPVMLAVLLTAYLIYPQGEILKPGRLSTLTFAANAALLCVYFAILFVYRKKGLRKTLSLLLTGIIIAELFSNAYVHFNHMGEGKREAYAAEFYDAMSEVASELAQETEFYRAEFKHHSTLTDARIFGYNGANAFGGLNTAVKDMMDKMGVTASTNLIVFSNPSPVINSVFAIKYLFNRREPMTDSFTLFELKKQVGNIFLYENPYVLPVGFMAKRELLGFDTASDNPYELQNQFLGLSAGTKRVFSDVRFAKVSSDFMKFALADGDNTLYYELSPEITAENITKETCPKIRLEFFSPENKNTYLHVRTGGATSAEVHVNGRPVLLQSFRIPATSLDAGFVPMGSKIELVLTMDKREEDESRELIRNGYITVNAAQLDMENYAAAVDKLSSGGLRVTYYDNMTVEGEVSASEDGLLFTSIPYEGDCFEVLVDGQKTEPLALLDAFMLIEIPAGEHVVELNYKLEGLFAGALLSAAAALMFVLISVYDYRNKRKRGILP